MYFGALFLFFPFHVRLSFVWRSKRRDVVLWLPPSKSSLEISKASGSWKAARTGGSHRTGSSTTRGPLNG